MYSLSPTVQMLYAWVMRRLPRRRRCAWVLTFYKAACIVQGKMRLVGTNTAQGQDESELLRLAAAVEGSTRHPLADAVLLAANKANLQVMCHCVT